ncbi:MAG: hypothetical protein Q8R83_03200 [Legionellaceae bacterium]|nr:hypothetical protein [Legionellaceae bacterium]
MKNKYLPNLKKPTPFGNEYLNRNKFQKAINQLRGLSKYFNNNIPESLDMTPTQLINLLNISALRQEVFNDKNKKKSTNPYLELSEITSPGGNRNNILINLLEFNSASLSTTSKLTNCVSELLNSMTGADATLFFKKLTENDAFKATLYKVLDTEAFESTQITPQATPLLNAIFNNVDSNISAKFIVDWLNYPDSLANTVDKALFYRNHVVRKYIIDNKTKYENRYAHLIELNYENQCITSFIGKLTNNGDKSDSMMLQLLVKSVLELELERNNLTVADREFIADFKKNLFALDPTTDIKSQVNDLMCNTIIDAQNEITYKISLTSLQKIYNSLCAITKWEKYPDTETKTNVSKSTRDSFLAIKNELTEIKSDESELDLQPVTNNNQSYH